MIWHCKIFRQLARTATLKSRRCDGPQLVETDVDHVVFTGSDTTGRKLAARLGERLIPSTLELSGCDAMFVLDDANLDMAARAVWFGANACWLP